MIPVSLSPKPGFCIKSATLSPSVFYLPEHQKTKDPNLLEPAAASGPVVVPQNRKVFVNVAWDSNVPPPPQGSEEAIQNAMQGGEDIDEDNPNGWFVPVIVSNAKADKDKAGNPSVVYDCVFHSSVRSRTLRDPEFKAFIIELALQRIEAQNGINLSRQIGTPNIASKGKLLPRTVQIPVSMLSQSPGLKNESAIASSLANNIISPPSNNLDRTQTNQPLIHEISTTRTDIKPTATEKSGNATITSTSLPGLRGILKQSSATTTSAAALSHVDQEEPLSWTWCKIDDESRPIRIKLEVEIPGLTISLVSSSSLDISARTLDLVIPGRKPLHIDLSISDAEIAARVAASYSNKSTSDEVKLRKSDRREETNRVLQLKRQKDFNVNGAEAEWRINSSVLVVYV